jgi:hypothetical protein
MVRTKAKCHTTCVVFEARSSALFAFFSAKALLQTQFNVPALVSPDGINPESAREQR